MIHLPGPMEEHSLEAVKQAIEKVWREARSARVLLHFNGKRFTGYEVTEFRQIVEEGGSRTEPGPASRQ